MSRRTCLTSPSARVTSSALLLDASAEVASVVREAMQSGKPSVVEVPIDHEELPPMKPRMAVMREPLGLPNPLKGVSLDTVKAVWRMARKR